jgi:hypothetical protein
MLSATENIMIAMAPRLRARTSPSAASIKSTPRTTICGDGKPAARAAGITNKMRSWIVSTKLSNCSRHRPRQTRVILMRRGCLARGQLWVVRTRKKATVWDTAGITNGRVSVSPETRLPLAGTSGRSATESMSSIL